MATKYTKTSGDPEVVVTQKRRSLSEEEVREKYAKWDKESPLYFEWFISYIARLARPGAKFVDIPTSLRFFFVQKKLNLPEFPTGMVGRKSVKLPPQEVVDIFIDFGWSAKESGNDFYRDRVGVPMLNKLLRKIRGEHVVKNALDDLEREIATTSVRKGIEVKTAIKTETEYLEDRINELMLKVDEQQRILEKISNDRDEAVKERDEYRTRIIEWQESVKNMVAEMYPEKPFEIPSLPAPPPVLQLLPLVNARAGLANLKRSMQSVSKDVIDAREHMTDAMSPQEQMLKSITDPNLRKSLEETGFQSLSQEEQAKVVDQRVEQVKNESSSIFMPLLRKILAMFKVVAQEEEQEQEKGEHWEELESVNASIESNACDACGGRALYEMGETHVCSDFCGAVLFLEKGGFSPEDVFV